MNLESIRRSARPRAILASRNRCRPTFEGLESRRLLSSIVWNGNGDGKSFGQGLNWVGGLVPTSADDALINPMVPANVVLPAGGITVNSITQVGGSLTLNSGTVTTKQAMTLTGVTMTMTSGTLSANGFELIDGTFNDQGGSTLFAGSSGYMLDNSTLNDGPGATIGFGLFGNCAINGAIPKAQNLSLTLPATSGSTVVTVPSGFVNNGGIFMGTVPSAPNPPTISLVVAGGGGFTNNGGIYTGFESVFAGQFFNDGTFLAGADNTALAAGASLVNESGGHAFFGGMPGSVFDVTAPGASFVNMPGGVIGAGTQSNTPCLIKTSSPQSFVNAGTLGVELLLTVEGDYTQTSTGTLGVQLEGTAAGMNFSQLVVTGMATLAGSVNVTLLDQYLPGTNTSFEIMTFGSASGNVTSYNGTSLSNGLTLRPIRTATDLTLTTGTVPTADLAVSVKASAGQVTLGGNVTYTVTLTNNGPNDAQAVALTDSLPSGAVVVSAMATTGSPTTSGGTVTLDLDTLADQATDTLTIVATPSTAGTFADAASVTDIDPFDPTLGNNQSSVSLTVVPPPSADLVVAVSIPPATTTGLLTFTASVYNSGPDPAVGTILTDTFTLPPGARLAGETAQQGTVQASGNVLTAAFGTIPAGLTRVLTVTVVTTASGSFTQAQAPPPRRPTRSRATTRPRSPRSSGVRTRSS